MAEGGRGGDKRKRAGQGREMVDVGGDIEKVKGREEREKLKRGSREQKGWAPFLLCWGAEAERRK